MNMVPGDLLGASVARHGYRGRINVSHGKYYMANVRVATVAVPATQGHSSASSSIRSSMPATMSTTLPPKSGAVLGGFSTNFIYLFG